MFTNKSLILIMSLTVFTLAVHAKKQIIFHFKLGKGTAVTYATGPEIIQAENSEGLTLNREGSPVFFASAPEGKTGGSILFTPENGHYFSPEKWADSSDNFAFEVWIKPRTDDRKDMDAKHTLGVVSLGDGKHGYNIVQQGDKWFALVGGVGMFEMGTVIHNTWTHLALVADETDCSLWENGEKRGTFRKTEKLNPGFTVGNVTHENKPFNGEVFEVRYAVFNGGDFDPAKDFLLNYEQLEEKSKLETEARKNRIKQIVQPGFGRVMNGRLQEQSVEEDYLIRQISRPSQLYLTKTDDELTGEMTLSNGLISRSFYLSDNLACISYQNLTNNAEYLRAVKPEARIRINNRWIDIGGLTGQPEKSYLLHEWLPQMETNPNAWILSGISTRKPEARYPWEQKYNARDAEWPPNGLHLILHFEAPGSEKELKGLKVDVHYELYDGIPVMAKWITLKNDSEHELVVEETETEVLAVNQDQINRIFVESDYSFALVNADPQGSGLLHFSGNPEPYQAGRTTTRWEVDPEYNTWATHNQAEDNFLGFRHHNLLKSQLPMGPSALLVPGEDFQSFRTFEILLDSDNEERNSLARRRMYRTLAPQVTESLLTAAITSHDPEKLKTMIDQMAELGFERLDIHPWPGIAHDNLDAEYLALWKEIADYARERGIIMGGYELVIASRSRGAEVDCIDPETGKPGSLFGQSVCIASEWKDEYFRKAFHFFDETGFKSWNADGPYHGDPCASTEHAYHRGLEDSQWEQWKVQVEILHKLQQRNFYVPLPDWYFLNGQCATGMGYREASANLTPQQQLLLGRQYIYDGTWHKIPTMGWMTLQLVGFYTNDPRVGLEPLKDNMEQYERGLVQHLGSGCQFTVRGNRLYDSVETKAMVKKWTGWYHQYREVLTGDIIHLGRPTGRGLDCMMHVNPFGKDKAMLLVFNPTSKPVKKKLTVPIYYTGLSEEATINEQGKDSRKYRIDREYKMYVEVEVDANGFTWLLIQ